MSTIYSNAVEVLAFLGQGNDSWLTALETLALIGTRHIFIQLLALRDIGSHGKIALVTSLTAEFMAASIRRRLGDLTFLKALLTRSTDITYSPQRAPWKRALRLSRIFG
jgi:hypothetical protein